MNTLRNWKPIRPNSTRAFNPSNIENQLRQLKTSLFFDHQRQAFAGILGKIAEVNRIWIEKEYHVPDEGLTGPVPYTAYQELRTVYYQHQLFLDPCCLAAIELIFECYHDSFDDEFEPTARPRYYDAAYRATEYLQPRLAELFRSRIGVTAPGHGEREIALLGSIRLLNRYHFPEIDLPPKGPFKLIDWEGAPEAVAKAEDNFRELVSRLKQLQGFLKQDNRFFHEAATKTTQYLTMLSEEQQADKP